MSINEEKMAEVKKSDILKLTQNELNLQRLNYLSCDIHSVIALYSCM